MNAQMIQSQSVAQQVTVESLATAHYEKVYAFFNAFLEDPTVCLELVTRSFRDAEESCGLSAVCIFSKAVARLNSQPGLEAPVALAPYESNLAWLLKDVGGLRYNEIGAILEMSHQEVKERIAEVRLVVLERLAA